MKSRARGVSNLVPAAVPQDGMELSELLAQALATITQPLRIVLDWTQIVSSFKTVLQIPWPSSYNSFASSTVFANIDFGKACP